MYKLKLTPIEEFFSYIYGERAHVQSSGRIFQTAKKKEEKIQITIRNLLAFHKKLVDNTQKHV